MMTPARAVPGLRHAWAWLCLLAGLAGCGEQSPKTYLVEGKISFKGKLLPLGILTFVPKDGKAEVCKINPDGSYKLRAPAGKHAVEVIAVPAREGGRRDPNVEGGIDYRGVPAPKPLVPEKYNRYTTSGIEVEVLPSDSNTIDIILP
jgi:hypothetical protein